MIGVSPFEAAHGLPARSAIQTFVETAPPATTSMGKDEIQAMQTAAKAMCEAIRLLRTHDKQARADAANKTRQKQTFKVGDTNYIKYATSKIYQQKMRLYFTT